MKCKCGYEGPAEVGDFGFDKTKLYRRHFKCPKCGSTDMSLIHSIDSIKRALLFPRKCSGVRGETPSHKEVEVVVNFLFGGANGSVGYSIHCPICGWGQGSAIIRDEYIELKRWAEENNVDSAVFPPLREG